MKPRIPYFDFYPVDFMNGVRGLSAQDVGVYTMVLCRVYEENGPIEFNTMRLSTYCGMREVTFKKVIEKLIALGKFDLSGGMLSNHRAETEIQNRSDKLKLNSKAGKASAQKRQQKQQPGSTSVQRPFNHTDTDTDTELKEGARGVSTPSHSHADWAFTEFCNRVAGSSIPAPRKLTADRKRKIEARLKEHGNETWLLACSKLAASAFCNGSNDRGWIADLDFLCQPKSFNRLIEGGYDNRASHGDDRRESDLQRISRMTKEMIRNGAVQ